MFDAAYILGFTVFVWWFSTGAILYLVGLMQKAYWPIVAATTIVAALGLFALPAAAETVSAGSAVLAFVLSLTIWGCLELLFLGGALTGWHNDECPSGATEGTRFFYASGTLAYNELALVGAGAAIYFTTAGLPNQTALATFAVLWLLRLSAKLNIFFGVRNVTEEFLPSHLDHLKSYFGRKPINLFFPISITIATIAIGVLGGLAFVPDAGPFEKTSYLLLATLTFLGVLEHWLMVLPVPAEALWRWGLASRQVSEPQHKLTTSSITDAATAVHRTSGSIASKAKSTHGVGQLTDPLISQATK